MVDNPQTGQPQARMFNASSNTMFENLAKEMEAAEKPANPEVESQNNNQEPPAQEPGTPEAKAEEVKIPVVEQKSEKAESKSVPLADTKLTEEEQTHIAYLKGDEGKVLGEAPAGDKVKVKEVDPEVQAKLAKYEKTFSDPLIKALAEFREKTGSSNINEFIEQAGLIDPKKLTMDQLYTQEAREVGFAGDELTEVVEEKMASFESLPKLDQKKIEKELREKALAKQDERLKSFTIDSGVDNVEYDKINGIASQQITEKAEKLANTKWKGFLITDELSKTIQELAPNYAIPVFDVKSQKLIGYNTDDAIEFAIWKAADNGRKILKANFDMGETSGFEKAMKDRTRVSENRTSGTITPSSHEVDQVDAALKEVAQNKHGRFSLSGK